MIAHINLHEEAVTINKIRNELKIVDLINQAFIPMSYSMQN